MFVTGRTNHTIKNYKMLLSPSKKIQIGKENEARQKNCRIGIKEGLKQTSSESKFKLWKEEHAVKVAGPSLHLHELGMSSRLLQPLKSEAMNK